MERYSITTEEFLDRALDAIKNGYKIGFYNYKTNVFVLPTDIGSGEGYLTIAFSGSRKDYYDLQRVLGDNFVHKWGELYSIPNEKKFIDIAKEYGCVIPKRSSKLSRPIDGSDAPARAEYKLSDWDELSEEDRKDIVRLGDASLDQWHEVNERISN